MLGAQAYWGALFIKLFGFSFLAVRLSTVPLAAGCAAVLYLLHRRADLPAGLALFGTLAVTLSPLFIPHAASFMTEVPSLFLFLLSIYGYSRVAESLDNASDPAAQRSAFWWIGFGGWLLFGLAAGLLGGTVRQVYWLVPVLVPAFLVVRGVTFRRLPLASALLVISSLVGLDSAIVFSKWFEDQPYVVHEKIAAGIAYLLSGGEAVAYLCRVVISMTQTVGLLIFPLLITLPLLYRRWLVNQRLAWFRLGGALAIGACYWVLACLCQEGVWVLAPCGNTFQYMVGAAPAPPESVLRTLPEVVWIACFVAVTVLSCGALGLLVANRLWPRSRRPEEQAGQRIPAVIELLLVFSAGYFPLLLLKALLPDGIIYDRYLLPIFPLATMGYLLMFQRWTGRDRFPLAAWFVLGLFGFYGVAQMHDYFAQLRARVIATQYLERRGIPRTRIMAGFEYDSWTQLEVAGHYNDSRIEKPEDAYIPPPESLGFNTIAGHWRNTPVVRPDYVVVLAEHPDLLTTDIPPTDYWCCLPPFRRCLQVQMTIPGASSSLRPPQIPALPPKP
jgi:hypothetical protein